MLPRFLSVDQVRTIHREMIARYGGLDGLRDHGLLEAAVAMPEQKYGGQYLHDGLPAMAAAYLFHLAKNHPFLDGNKRVALGAAIGSLRVNGVTVEADPDDLVTMTLKVAAGEVSKDALTAWLRELVAR